MMKYLTFAHSSRSVIKLMLLASCLVLKHGCSLSDESSDQHLAPHEVKLYEALNNIHLNDAEELRSLHAHDARIELACGKDQVRIGSFQDAFGQIQSKIELVKTKIEPITTTNDTSPERGIFSFHWFTFMKTKDDCTAIFSGFATVKVSICLMILSPLVHIPLHLYP